MGKGRPYKLDSLIKFGKYGPLSPNNRTIRWIIKHDPEYLDWCFVNIENFKLTEEAEMQLDEALDEN